MRHYGVMEEFFRYLERQPLEDALRMARHEYRVQLEFDRERFNFICEELRESARPKDAPTPTTIIPARLNSRSGVYGEQYG